MHRSAARAALIAAVTVVCLAGCRNYGNEAAAEATYAQMQEAYQVFEEELVRARADLQKLQQAAGGADAIAFAAEQFSQTIRGHEAVLDEQAIVIGRMSADDDYRDLSRAFGSIIAQQETIRIQYQGLLRHLQQTMQASDTTSQASDTTSRAIERPYSLIPPYYARVSTSERDLSVADLLAEAPSGLDSAAASVLQPDTSLQPQSPPSDAGAAVDTVAN